MEASESKEPQIECADCGKHFVWGEAYKCSETPGPVPNPPTHGNWLPRVFCPHCGALVVQWHITQEKDFDEWLWFGDNAKLNANKSLPRATIYLWGIDIPQQFLPDYSEHRLELEKVKLFFIEALKSRDDNEREEAAWALSKMKDPRAVEPLIQALKDKNKGVRLFAAKALEEIGDARAADALKEALKDGDEDVRKEAQEALRKIRDAKAVEPPTETGKDDESVAESAVEALAKMGYGGAVEPLAKALKDDEGVQREAEETSAKVSEASPLEEVDSAPGDVADIVSQYSDKIKHNKIFFAPDIPEKKLANAIKKFANIQEGERPLVLYDETVFGSAKIGLLVTDRRIYGRETGEKPQSWAIQDIQDISFEKKWTGKIFYINSYKFLTATQIGENEVADLIELIKRMSSSLRQTQYADVVGVGGEAEVVDESPGEKEPSQEVRLELLDKIEVYCEAMHFLATCGDFDAAKFERLDAILSRAGASFGAAKRREMLSEAALILPTRTTGGVAELHVQLQDSLAQAFEAFNKALAEISPTAETAAEVQRILDKYRV